MVFFNESSFFEPKLEQSLLSLNSICSTHSNAILFKFSIALEQTTIHTATEFVDNFNILLDGIRICSDDSTQKKKLNQKYLKHFEGNVQDASNYEKMKVKFETSAKKYQCHLKLANTYKRGTYFTS